MVWLGDNTASEQLRRISIHLGGDFIENYGSSKCILHNEKAKGQINSYNLLPGLSVRTYDIKFHDEFRFCGGERGLNSLYFIYCVKGTCYHHFGETEEPVRLEEKQNVILMSGPHLSHELILLPGIHLRLGIICLNQNEFIKDTTAIRPLESSLTDIFDLFNVPKPYRFLGQIDFELAEHVNLIIDNKRTDIVGKMITEGAAMNIIAAQIQGFENNSRNSLGKSPLSIREISRISGIADYIKNHISEKVTLIKVSNELGMSPKKVQEGIKYLFGQTFGQFLQAVRMEYARKLFLTTDKNVSEISTDVGLNSKSYFSKLFSQRFDVKPSSYREFLLSENMLFELSYRSSASPNVSQSDIKDIIQKARKFNRLNNITGCLILHDGTFFQILEGRKRAVLQLMKNIKNDKRHYEIEVLWKGPKAKRIFADWNMALVSEKGTIDLPVQGQSKNINLKHLEGKIHEPAMASEILWRRVRNVIKSTG